VKRSVFLTLDDRERATLDDLLLVFATYAEEEVDTLTSYATLARSRRWDDPERTKAACVLADSYGVGAFGKKDAEEEDDGSTDDEWVAGQIDDVCPAALFCTHTHSPPFPWQLIAESPISLDRPQIPTFKEDGVRCFHHFLLLSLTTTLFFPGPPHVQCGRAG
jgi:hypothetical protein